MILSLKIEYHGQPLVGHTCKTVSARGPIVNSLAELPVAVPSARICMTYIFAFKTEGAVAENLIVFASLCVSIDVFSLPTIFVVQQLQFQRRRHRLQLSLSSVCLYLV